MHLTRLSARLSAFTYVELMMVLGILGVLLSISILSIGPLLSKTSVKEQSQILLADSSLTQLKSMRREQGGSGQTTPFGIYFEPGKYVLFQGAAYNAADPENIEVVLSEDLNFSSILLPSSIVQFTRGSGDVTAYNPAASSVIMTQVSTGTSVIVQYNRYGIAELIE